MNIHHHLDPATLSSYSSGALSQAMALVVACHLSMCKECQQKLAEHEAVGGALLNNLDEANVSESALSQVLAGLDAEPDIQPQVRTKPASASTPQPLAQYLGCDVEDVDWQIMGPGVHYHDINCNSSRGVSRLLRIAPGKAMLPHSHDGNELTLILQGSFSDEIGRFRRGDIADLDGEISHQPMVDSQEDCICLVATDAPLKFNTLLGKLVQPFTGF